MLKVLESVGLRDKNHKFDLVEITADNVSYLSKILKKLNREDPYSASAAYYMMTGRKGLWIYGDDKTAMLITRHPNIENEILFFPPFGSDPINLIEFALADPSIPVGKVSLARIGPEDSYIASRLQTLGIGEIEVEKILDWRFPVHVIGINEVNESKGGHFRDFRKNIHRAFGRGLWSERIESPEQVAHALEVSKAWASRHVNQSYSLSDLIGPTKLALSLLQHPDLSMDGLIVHEGEDPVGYIIWEETNKDKGVANSISGMSIRPRGTEEFAILEMCKILKTKGYSQVCIGGSETEGLDNFKRKICPVKSVALQTMHLNS